MEENPPVFEGFTPPTEYYFSLPHEWMDICAQITSLAELKIILYIARHTWGYHEYNIPKPFTLDEFMYGRKDKDGTRMDEGTGLSRQSVVNGLQRALADGYLLCETDDSDKARIKKYYMLKMREAQTSEPAPAVNNVDHSVPESTPPRLPIVTADVINCYHGGLDSSSQESTIQIAEVNDIDSSGTESAPQRLPIVTSKVTNHHPRGLDSTLQKLRINTSEVTNGDSRGNESTPRSEKDTREKHQKKNTKERHVKKNTREKQAMRAHSPLSEQAHVISSACRVLSLETFPAKRGWCAAVVEPGEEGAHSSRWPFSAIPRPVPGCIAHAFSPLLRAASLEDPSSRVPYQVLAHPYLSCSTIAGRKAIR